MTRAQILGAGALATVLLVLGFCWKHDSDKKAEGRIQMLEAQHVQDSIARVKSEAHTDSVIVGSRVDVLAARHVDTLWRTKSTTIIQSIHDVAADTTKPDSAKVRIITAKADSLKAWGDSVAASNQRLVFRVEELQTATTDERAAHARERATLQTEIKELKKLARHWGLGGSLGYSAVRTPDGSIKTGPALNLGIVYRW